MRCRTRFYQIRFFCKLREKVSEKVFILSQGWTCKKDRNKAGMRKLKNTTLLRNDGGLQRNALASLVHFVVCKVNQGCKCIVLEAREEGAIIPQQGSVLEFSHPCLVSVLFTGPSLTRPEVFSETFFPQFLFFFGGVSKPTSKQKTNVFIASDKIVSATHLQI